MFDNTLNSIFDNLFLLFLSVGLLLLLFLQLNMGLDNIGLLTFDAWIMQRNFSFLIIALPLRQFLALVVLGR